MYKIYVFLQQHALANQWQKYNLERFFAVHGGNRFVF